ncbi:glutathione S-transferase [Ralstonia syzygii]|uniref:glutathione S-transferase n=1 Tax=Ralstonia syzygii TaxID=28097 RepID=UPI0018D11111|nr:glutathione S-transferase [Ralstonia syzygii]
MPTDRHLILYHAPHSRSAGARMLLEELNADYALHPLNFKTNEQRAPAYLEINPMGKVPALRHGDVLITEQAAVYMYAAELYAEAGLSPAVGDLLGERFTAADVLWGAALHWMVGFKLVPETPVIRAYIDRIQARPAIQRAQALDEALAAELSAAAA